MSLLTSNPIFASIKMYAYGAVVTIGLAFSIYVVVHERHVGEAKILARDVIITTQRQKIADAAIQHTKDVQALAQSLSDRLGETFEKAVATPVVSPPHVLCYRAAPTASGSGVPQTASDQSKDPSAAVERAEAPVDIGPAVVEVGKDADAQINALLDQILVLTDEMNGKSK